MQQIFLVSYTPDTQNQNPAPLHNWDTLENALIWVRRQIRSWRCQNRGNGERITVKETKNVYDGFRFGELRDYEVRVTRAGRRAAFIIEPQTVHTFTRAEL